MNLLTLENISKSYSEKILLDNVSLGINDNDKIGIIGVNGAGKSTLLKIIAGIDEFYTGDIVKGKKVRVEYLPQHTDFNDELTVLEAIFKSGTDEMKLLKKYEELLEKIQINNDDSLNNQLMKLQEEIDNRNLWELESEAKTILNKLGIDKYDAKIKELSGGQKKRIALAAALISPCDLLILDEPTNHLDSNLIEWLEEYLNSKKGALLMITHDRYFLDRVTNRIIELDRGKLYTYEGNYTTFLQKKEERLQVEESNEEKRKNLIRNELKWVRRGAKARSTKQKARLDRFKELVDFEYVKPQKMQDIAFIGTRLGKKIIEIKDLSKNFEDKNIIDNFNYIFTKEDRIGIIGNNGIGKSTLINLIRGKIRDYSGSIEIGDTVKIACFAQENDEMNMNMKAIDYIREGGEYIKVADGSQITASQLCERFLFDGNLQYSKIEKLSGGERRRLYLLRVLMESPNVLLLDEPTNDLDINTLTILEDYLDSFIGVIVVVSHDRYFLDRICNKIFAYRGNGKIKVYNGNFSDYEIQNEIEKNNESQDKEVSQNKKTNKRINERDNRPKFTFKENKEYEVIESEINELEDKINEIDNLMVENATSYGKLQELTEEKEKLEKELNYKYERYEYLENKAEEIRQYKNN